MATLNLQVDYDVDEFRKVGSSVQTCEEACPPLLSAGWFSATSSDTIEIQYTYYPGYSSTEIQNLMEEVMNVNFHKIWMNDFENLDIAPARNTRIGLFIKYLVTEVRDLQMIQ